MFADYAARSGEPRQRPPEAPARPSGQAANRTMQPEELAEVIVFLVSPAGARINGQAITVG
jgi:NAD(P)-dependent dehydrogenase (short-subunit alcohol dehydrogenase family)